MQKFSLLLLSGILLFILGTGCTDNEKTNRQRTKPLTKPSITNNTTIDTSPEKSAITLTAQATDPNTVQFDWEPNDELTEMSEGWRIVYSEEENPTYPSLWWYERGETHREKLWKGLPAGDAHFRVCAVVDDECQVYSNDVSITVKGEKELSAQELCEQTDGAVWEQESESCFENTNMMMSDEKNNE